MNPLEILEEARVFVNENFEEAKKSLELPILVSDPDEIRNLKVEYLLELKRIFQNRIFCIDRQAFFLIWRKNRLLKKSLKALQDDFQRTKDSARIRRELTMLEIQKTEEMDIENEKLASQCLSKTKKLFLESISIIVEKYKIKKEEISRNRKFSRICPLD